MHRAIETIKAHATLRHRVPSGVGPGPLVRAGRDTLALCVRPVWLAVGTVAELGSGLVSVDVEALDLPGDHLFPRDARERLSP